MKKIYFSLVSILFLSSNSFAFKIDWFVEVQHDSIRPVCGEPIINPKNFSVEDIGFPFNSVDEKPMFEVCKNVPKDKQFDCFKENLDKHIQKNMYYSEHHHCEMPLKTRVIVQFRINTDGSVTIANVRSPDEFFDIKAREIIQKLPRFIPGKHQGKPVAVYCFYPILFKYD